MFAAQEQEEQLTVLNVMQPAATDAGAADNTAQKRESTDSAANVSAHSDVESDHEHE